MASTINVPEISPQEVARKLKEAAELVLLDVREDWEIRLAELRDERVKYAPLSQLATRGVEALPSEAQDREAEIVVMCHHGVRSADVTAWLLQQGWQKVSSLAGGLEAYALAVDERVGRY